MIPLLLALSVTVEPAFGLECRPIWNAGASVIEASNDGDPQRVTVEIADYQGNIAEVELDLPTRSHKRLLVMPPLGGRVDLNLVSEDGTRALLSYPFRQECKGPAVAALLRDDGRAGFAIPRDIAGTPIEVGELRREDIPGAWRPLMSLDAIAAEARALAELSDAEFAVIEQWTRSGGVLVIVPGVDPAALHRKGRVPEGLAVGRDWQSAKWGSGAVVITDPAVQDARLASLILVTSAERTTWGQGISRIFEAQRHRSGPAGRTSQPAGVMSLAVVLLAAAIAHELLRRRFITGSRDFPAYFRGLGVALGSASVFGLLAAFVGRTDQRMTDLVVARSGGWGIHSRAWVIPAGGTQSLPDGVWPFFERDNRFVMGARTAVRNVSGGTRVVLERTPIDVGGAITIDSVANPVSLKNGSEIDFEAAWLVERNSCRRIPAVARGSQARIPAPDRCPQDEAVALVAQGALAGSPWYVARSGGRMYAVQLEAP